jgi:pimeloyl-ACP methyl ester carboxylesterase
MRLIFFHANSFPASTYRVLFRSLRARGYTVRALEKIGHDPAYPVSNNWPHLAKQVRDFAQAEMQKSGEPTWLVGHSLGGFLSLMVAARCPELVAQGLQGVVLLDSPVLGGWKATALRLGKKMPLMESMSPGKVSRTRRNQWPSRAAALEAFQAKKAFARWEPQMLKDYIQHGMAVDQNDASGKCVLSFSREIETAIYNTLPDNLEGLLKRHPLQCPVAFLGGRLSHELKRVGIDLTRKITHNRITMMDGGHLFPMEHPLPTAAAIDAAIKAMKSPANTRF